MRRAHLEAVGLFDPAFEGMGWEDVDLGRRLKKFGLKRLLSREALAYHVEPSSRNEAQLNARLEKERERGASAHHYMAKHPEFRTRLSAQATALNQFLAWAFRMGGLVREDNVLAWVAWARRRLVALENMWLNGVFAKVDLESLDAARAARRRKG